MKHTIKQLIIVTATAVALAGSVAASATANEAGVSVKYRTSDLTTAYGRAKVYQKLEDAARSLCGTESYRKAGSLDAVRDNRNCFIETMDRSVKKIDNDALTELHKRS